MLNLHNFCESKQIIKIEMTPFKTLIQFYEGIYEKEITIKNSFNKIEFKLGLLKAIT